MQILNSVFQVAGPSLHKAAKFSYKNLNPLTSSNNFQRAAVISIWGGVKNTAYSLLGWERFAPINSALLAVPNTLGWIAAKVMGAYSESLLPQSNKAEFKESGEPLAHEDPRFALGMNPECIRDPYCAEKTHFSEGVSFTSHFLPAAILVGTLWLATYIYQQYTADDKEETKSEEKPKTDKIKA